MEFEIDPKEIWQRMLSLQVRLGNGGIDTTEYANRMFPYVNALEEFANRGGDMGELT